MEIDVNTNGVIYFTNKLEKLNRSAFPNAVRATLNSAAFDVKQKTMPAQARLEFVHRSPNFFKANSKVEMATGWNLHQMKSQVGFKSTNGKNQAVEDLKQQEHGGTIGGRSFIPMDMARIGKTDGGMVKSGFRMGKMKNVVDARMVNAKSKKQRFIKAAFKAKELYGNNAYVLGNPWSGGKRTLSKIDEISSSVKNRQLQIKRTPLYTFVKGRKISVAGTNFMKRASMESGLKMEKFYIIEATKQFKKAQLL